MSVENKASIEIPSGVKVLTATPLDTKSRVQSLTDIANNPSYYVGYFPIYCLDDSKHYKVSGGDATSGWTFEEGSGNSLPLEEVGNKKGVKYSGDSASNIDWVSDDDTLATIGQIKANISGNVSKDIDGGASSSVYLTSQLIDGGNANL